MIPKLSEDAPHALSPQNTFYLHKCNDTGRC